MPVHLQNTDKYATAFYFVVSTATTVGYGDFFGTTGYEKLWLIIMQFAGICIFSLVTGSTNLAIHQPDMNKIINAKVVDIKIYLQKIDRVLKNVKLESEIYDNTITYIEHSYRIGVV